MTGLLLATLLAGPARADRAGASPAQLAFDAGVAAERAGDPSAAAQRFREALTEGGRDPAVYHGLGNALYREGHRGLAIAAWRRGAALDPGNGDLRANIDRVRRETSDRLDPPEPDLGPFFWQRSLSVTQSAGLASALLTLALAVPALQAASAGRGWTWLLRLRPYAVIAAVLSLLLLGSTAAALRAPPTAVVVFPELVARSTVGPDGTDLFAVHEGAELRVLEQSGSAALVALPDERKGWVSLSALASTDPAAPFPDPVL